MSVGNVTGWQNQMISFKTQQHSAVACSWGLEVTPKLLVGAKPFSTTASTPLNHKHSGCKMHGMPEASDVPTVNLNAVSA